jgi:hypothetical protein
MLRSLVNDLQEFTIHATDGDIGRVDHFLFDDQQWTVRYVVVDTGKWLPGRRVLISPRAVGRVDTGDRTLRLDLTREKVRDSPDIDTDKPVSRQKEEELHTYYGYPEYWGYLGGPGAWAAWSHPPNAVAPPLRDPGTGAPPPAAHPDAAPEGRTSADPHLRSSKEVAGYTIHARDGEIGHVSDFVVDEDAWRIRYLVVKTGGWIGGRHVLVSPDWVTGIEWERSRVALDVTRERVEQAPEYDGSRALDREAEEAMHQHYQRAPYWTRHSG